MVLSFKIALPYLQSLAKANPFRFADKSEDWISSPSSLNSILSANLKGLAFARDCKYGSAILKLNTIEDKLTNKYYKQLDILKMMQEGRYDLEK